MGKADYQMKDDEPIKREYPNGREQFALGYGKAIKEVKARLIASRRKMIEAYRKKLDVLPDKEAYHGATAVMAQEVETLIEELGKIAV